MKKKLKSGILIFFKLTVYNTNIFSSSLNEGEKKIKIITLFEPKRMTMFFVWKLTE